EVLHQKDIVFGDLRQPNIMISKDHAMLVDSDWAGKHGEACYLTTLNNLGDVVWPPGVVCGGIMQMEHDDFMLEQLSLSV
ncbi:uncharacterized protein EI90DRAFT_2944096, partial [Cantharellus anzutake]|uniref:uncharacterized protein n=1 Tax=Cantharellus anzutake TaxID=1750568 RepID=UPI0019072B11